MKNKFKQPVKADDTLNSPVIIGTYEGECADATITNKNGLDITEPVWRNVFDSEDYKQGIELGWFIGYLGHPEDPNCMDFKDACIVMTEGHIENNGKVYGKFNLIDTPVGRIVKSFQDAGVQFGISVRGAGDIENNSVDPDTFVFRGFDLVTFPAYPDAIPTFTAVAASTDAEKQQKYKTVCKTLKENLESVTSASSIEVLKKQFAPQSAEYKALEDRQFELDDSTEEETLDLSNEKLVCMTNMYLETVEANKQLEAKIHSLESELKSTKIQANRKLKSVKRISGQQIDSLEKSSIEASRELNRKLKSSEGDNLKYKQKIDATTRELRKKDSIISKLQSELHETVVAATDSKNRTSNLDEKCKKLKDEVKACRKLVEEYQDAYASLYSTAIGVDLKDVCVKANTSVKDLQKIISGTIVTEELKDINDLPYPDDIVDDEYLEDSDELVTL